MANNSEKSSTHPWLKHALGSCIYRTEWTAGAGLRWQPAKGCWCS
jgi:hypothetical protein